MERAPLIVRCAGLEEGGTFPLVATGRGEDRSPEFLIGNLLPEAKTLLITLEDRTHPIRGFTHWIIWNLPAGDRIPAAIPAGRTVPSLGNAVQGVGYGVHRYAGPKPPKGKTHTYQFTVYALDCRLDISAGARKNAVLRRAEAHILQKGSLTGRYE